MRATNQRAAGIRSGWRRWACRIAALVGAVAVALLLAEVAILLFPNLLNNKLQHAAFSRYDTLPGGIYRYEGITRMRFMRPNVRTRAFSHGYTWTHRTDERGFRNPPEIDDHHVLLLGDSLIYGHGVEVENTVSEILRREHRTPVYNLAAQGQCIYEHYVLLRLLLDELDPGTVMLFVFLNDVHDLVKLRRLDYEPKPPELARFDYGLIRDRLDALMAHRYGWTIRTAYSSSLFRLFAKMHRWRPAPPDESRTPAEWRAPPTSRSPGSRPEPKSAPPFVLDGRRFAPIEDYYDAVLGDLAARCASRRVRLAVIHLVPPSEIDWPMRERAQVALHDSLASICGRHGIELFDTRELFGDRTALILPQDGHLNPAGHRVLAEFLANEVLGGG